MFTLGAGKTLAASGPTAVNFFVFGDAVTTTDAFDILAKGSVSVAPTVIYTATGVQALIKTLEFFNTAGTPSTIFLYANGTATTDRFFTATIPAGGTLTHAAAGWQLTDSTGTTLVTATPITATGDATGTQVGSALPLTLATVNGAPGTFGSATQVSQVTVNAKGLATTVASVSIQIAESQVTNLVTDLAGKQPTGNYVTALTGDGTATGPGSVAFTLASVNGAPGTFGSATQVSQVTVNGKGLATTVASVSIQIAESQVTNLVTDLAGKQPTGNYITALTGDATATGPGSVAITLATVNATTGTFGSSAAVPVLTVNGKGLITNVVATSIQLASTGQVGFLSVAGFKKLAGYYDMVADWGFVGDDATDNLAAWVAFKAAIPNNSICYFPAGTYRFSAEATLDQDKHLQFHGAGANVSTLKIMAAAANLINITGAGANAWFNTFSDLGFASGVTKTAGAHIGINVATAIGIDIRRCVFSGHFIGIDAQGAQAGNVSVWDSIQMSAPAVNGRGIRINGSVINLTLMNSTINGVPNAGAIAGSANIEINQSGSVQIVGCDLIGAVNSVLLNANQGGGSSIAAVYITNTFFDQSGGSTFKIAGANTTNRIKLVQCGIAAGLIGTAAFEVAGTGTGGVGSATAMPAGISLVDCDIYYAPGASTSSGILINGCQDINIQNTRVAGFSGAGGSGIHVIPSSLNQTRVRVNGCRVGPNSNLTINNTIGIQLDVGSSGLGALSITDNDVAGNGTAISDASTILAGSSKFINNNLGAANGLSGNLFAPAGVALTATEAVIAQIALPANSVKVGTTFQFAMNGISTATAMQVKLHIGPLGTIADPAVIATAATAAGTAGGLDVTGQAQISVVGATAGGSGSARVSAGTVTNTQAVTATGTFNSTVANFATLSAIGAAGGHTVRAATMTVTGPA